LIDVDYSVFVDDDDDVDYSSVAYALHYCIGWHTPPILVQFFYFLTFT